MFPILWENKNVAPAASGPLLEKRYDAQRVTHLSQFLVGYEHIEDIYHDMTLGVF